MGSAGAIPAAAARSSIRVEANIAQASKPAPVTSVAAAAANSPRARHRGNVLDHGNGGRGIETGREAEKQEERLRMLSARLADAAALEFRHQRDKAFALRLLAAWRFAAARERARREAVSRLLRSCRQRRLNRGFVRWRAGARGARDQDERRAARERTAAAAATAKEAVAAAAKAVEAAAAATAAKAAAEKLAREKEEELRHEKAAAEELRRTVERLQAEVCGCCVVLRTENL